MPRYKVVFTVTPSHMVLHSVIEVEVYASNPVEAMTRVREIIVGDIDIQSITKVS